MIDARVRAALRGQLLTVVNGDLLAEQNTHFDPPDTPWFRETLLPGTPELVEIMRDGRARTHGVYQVDAFVPAGQGTPVADQLAEDVAEAFPRGAAFIEDGLTVRIRRSYTRPSRSSGDWYMTPVVIDWWADS
ncbi:MAG: phage tail terminator-like protein [Alkalispirochaeta sp.]